MKDHIVNEKEVNFETKEQQVLKTVTKRKNCR